MRIISSNGKTLTVKRESLFWRNVKGKTGTKWSYVPVEENAGLITSDNGYCFKRFANEIKLEDCPASKDDWTDCYLFQIKIGIDPDSINKCRRTIERARNLDIDYDCGKKPTKPVQPCKTTIDRTNNLNRRTNNKIRKRRRGRRHSESDHWCDSISDSYSDTSSSYRDRFSNGQRNFLKDKSTDDSSEKENTSKNKQNLVSSEINELFVLKNLLSKFAHSVKSHNDMSETE